MIRQTIAPTGSDPSGEAGLLGLGIGGITGAYSGFLGGISSGNIWGGIVGGVVGGTTGALLGFAVEGTLGGTAGGAFGGVVGGTVGSALGKRWGIPNASSKEVILAASKGGLIGGITGVIGGWLTNAAKTVVGATGASVDIATSMINAPIAWGLGLIDFESAFDKDKQSQEDINVPTIPEEYTPLPAPPLKYDPSNPDEIDRNETITLSVIGGCSPYTWSVSGTGFSLESEGEPTGSTNKLYADNTACFATIKVIDSCGDDDVTGFVRCTAGTWILIEDLDDGYTEYCHRIIGNYLYRFYPLITCEASPQPECPYITCEELAEDPKSRYIPELVATDWCSSGEGSCERYDLLSLRCSLLVGQCPSWCDSSRIQCSSVFLLKRWEWGCE
jgi:hypothetical protein